MYTIVKRVSRWFGSVKKPKPYDWRDDPNKNIYRTTKMEHMREDPWERPVPYVYSDRDR